jgi:hypothetical protein
MMKGLDGGTDAWYSTTYTIGKGEVAAFINHARDHMWQAKIPKRPATISNQCHPC